MRRLLLVTPVIAFSLLAGCSETEADPAKTAASALAAPTAAVDPVAKVAEVGTDEMPAPVVKDGAVTSLTWDGVPERDNNGDVLVAYVEKGEGAELTADSSVEAHYYGATPFADEAFDSSFAGGGDPIGFPLSGVIQGWRDGLTGVPVGSKVMLGIPSRYAYGTAGQGSIEPNAYLYFYVDVVSAS